jgi:hypothetical protein
LFDPQALQAIYTTTHPLIFKLMDRVTESDGLKVFTIDHLHGQGITFQDLENEDAWLSMKNGLNLREWA